MMKKLVAIALLLVPSLIAISQETNTVVTQKADDSWKENFWEMSHEERGELLADPNTDVDEVMKFIKSNRGKFETPLKKAGGDEAIFGCTFWYDHDLISVNELADNNWELFQGGCGAGQGVDAYWGQVNIDFDFCLYGQTYNHFYINTKGTLSFGEPMCDWTPDAFPQANQWNQVAGLWADFDFTVSGLCFWEVTPTAAIISFVNVGYWPGQGGLTNTMQMVITDGNDPILPEGYNVGFFYGDMGWCHGGVGGTNGCCGPNPAIVGLDRANTTDGLQIGAFNLLSNEFNGPTEESGVHWLDNKQLFLKGCEDGGDVVNHPPVPTNGNAMFDGVWPELACDTIKVCLNDTVDLFASYLAPESGQTVTLTIDDSDAPLLIIDEQTSGSNAEFHGLLVGAAPYIGMHTLNITATDNGSPVASVTQTFVIQVLNQAAPDITLEGLEAICAGQDAPWSVTPTDLDYYIWSSGQQGPTTTDVEIGYGGTFWVQAFDEGCMTQEYFEINESDYFLPQITYSPTNLACEGDPVEVCFTQDYAGGSWITCVTDPPGFDCPDPGYWDGPCATLGPGFYEAHAQDAEGCEGLNVFQIFPQAATIPTLEFDPFCNDLQPAEFEGGFANPGAGNLTIWWTDPDGAYAGGSYIFVTVNAGQGPPNEAEYIFAMLGNGTFEWNINNQQIPIEFGDEITVEFVESGTDNGNNSIQIYNCGNANEVYNGTPSDSGILWEGIAACSAEPATGTWTQEGCDCDGTFSNPGEFDGTFTPCDYGTYTLTFEESTCNSTYTYELEYTEAPSNVALSPSTFQELCPGESVDFTGSFDVPTDCGLELTWSQATPSGDGTQASYASADECTIETVVFEVANGCGSEQVSVQVQSAEPINANLDSQVLCEGGTYILDPVENDPSCFTYDWSTGSTEPQDTVDFTGYYEVTISSGCEEVTVGANIDFAAGYVGPGPYNVVECDEDFYVLDAGNVFNDYTWFWGTNPNVNVNEQTFTIEGEGTYTVLLQVTDDLDCNTYVTEYNVTIDDYPVINQVPGANDTVYVCPTEIEILDMGYSAGNFYSWLIDCPGDPIIIETEGDKLEIGSDMFPPACLNEFITITGTADNICPGDASATWVVQASLCPITPPNVFSPNEDNLGNDRFVIDGIEVYDSTELFVYDRWGKLIFHSDDYDNTWRAPDVGEGTYFYIAQMKDRTDKIVREIESSLTILRK